MGDFVSRHHLLSALVCCVELWRNALGLVVLAHPYHAAIRDNSNLLTTIGTYRQRHELHAAYDCKTTTAGMLKL